MRLLLDECVPRPLLRDLVGHDAHHVVDIRNNALGVSDTLERVRALAARGEVRVSAHGYDELAADDVEVRDVVGGLALAVVVEDYPEYSKGPCVLVLQRDRAGQPIHVVWGIPPERDAPAVVVTAYRPDPAKWDETWQRRRR